MLYLCVKRKSTCATLAPTTGQYVLQHYHCMAGWVSSICVQVFICDFVILILLQIALTSALVHVNLLALMSFPEQHVIFYQNLKPCIKCPLCSSRCQASHFGRQAAAVKYCICPIQMMQAWYALDQTSSKWGSRLVPNCILLGLKVQLWSSCQVAKPAQWQCWIVGKAANCLAWLARESGSNVRHVSAKLSHSKSCWYTSCY